MTKAQQTQSPEPEQITPSDPADDAELQAALREFEEQEGRLAEMYKRLADLEVQTKEANAVLTAAEDDEQDALEVYAENGDTRALDKATAAARAAQSRFVDVEKRRVAVADAIHARKPEVMAAESRLRVAKMRYWQAREQAAMARLREALPLIAEVYWCHQGAMDSSEPIWAYLHDPAQRIGLTDNVLSAHQPTGPVPLGRVASRFLDAAERFNISEYQRRQPKPQEII